MVLNNKNKYRFQKEILDWFQANRRDFPWRRTSNPYSILIAEKLLQQTVARATVTEAYGEILNRYPDPASLAQANLRDLKRIIRPLGFEYRAKELRLLARKIVSEHNHEIPATLEGLMALPGVGDYAARAILSFAYGKDVPVVDTNVARFLFRLYGIEAPFPANPARKKYLTQLAAELIPIGQSREFNWAILDLCAEICRPRTPRCVECPVQQYCEYGTLQVEQITTSLRK